ncbi:DUF2975 domain-containing protein [Gaoshiqia sediminis]|uniref:DUF2975 domain-containing protein n=1 Tax=Gaoshiqia sediminis TaxID=2986998 RepID=A0AA41Y7K3_9BACT|nr:DUF2975 domain-containing protein [Gaoshiqia sediminis]MCW0482572.1 DUF2975 domain-containing protein [Gaoshiqia sediminis]
MNNSINLVKVLKVLFRAAFLLSIVVGGVVLLMDIFSTDRNIGSFYSNAHHSAGYPMPVIVKVDFPDSIISYKYPGGGGSITYGKGREIDVYMKELSDSLSMLPNVEKDVITNEARFYPEEARALQLGYSSLTTDGYLYFRSQNLFITFLMVLHTYLSLILFAVCFFQLWKIFASLERSFSFHVVIIKRLNWLGALLVLSELVKVAMHMIFRSYWGLARITTLNNGRFVSSGVDLSFNPNLDVNWLLILLGLSVFVLSALLKIGYNLEQENQLTI